MSYMYIKHIIIEAKHGVYQNEKENLQHFDVSVKLKVDTTKAGISDDVEDTVDWSQIRQTIIDTVKNNSFNLMERLAKEIADKILLDQRIESVAVTIEKPDAFDNGTPAIELELSRS